MKKTFLSIIIAGIFVTGCQKAKNEAMDAQSSLIDQTGIITVPFQSVSLRPLSPDSKGVIISEGTVNPGVLSEDVVAGGLVLAFAKTASTVSTLPYSENNVEWNYDVSANEIGISAFGKEEQESAELSFVIISTGKLAELERQGYSRSSLLNVNYQEAKNLFGIQ